MTIQSIPPERRRIKHYLLALIVGISLKELTSALLVVAFNKEHVRTADAKGLYDIFFQPERRHKSLYALFTAYSDKVKISCNRAFEMGRYILLAVIAELFSMLRRNAKAEPLSFPHAFCRKSQAQNSCI